MQNRDTAFAKHGHRCPQFRRVAGVDVEVARNVLKGGRYSA
jgi:hypothetical protein